MNPKYTQENAPSDPTEGWLRSAMEANRLRARGLDLSRAQMRKALERIGYRFGKEEKRDESDESGR